MPDMTSWIKIITVLCGAAALFACSNGNSNGPLVDSTGKHPADWLEQHWVVYNSTTPGAAKLVGKRVGDAVTVSNSPCAECHGSDLSGGISKVSCFSAQAQNGQQCHATTLGHPDGWDNATQHGKSGAMAAPAISSGFAYCTKCHGSDFKGGTGKAVSCLSCHTTAPHPKKPWRGTTTSGTNHVNTNTANAAECAKCHLNGANLVGQQIGVIAPAGTAPGCFNGTLCHDTGVAPHPTNAGFLSPAAHGPLAKANLAICQACHATPASGSNPQFNVPRNNMVNGCESCHKINTAHPTPWLPDRGGITGTPFNRPNTTTHASAGNLATACAICHVTNGTTGAAAGVPPCMSCHTASSPVTTPTGCTSCHASSPTSGAHGKHLGLPNVTCQACHFGAGATGDINTPAIGRANHALSTTAFMALLAIDPASNSYLAKTGAFSLNPDKTCSSVRCHGGQTTPAWTAVPGTIVVNTDCLKCHEQVGNTPQIPQFNSFFSGSFGLVNLHQFHLLQTNPGTVRPVFCTDCHNTASLTNQQHFGSLATSSFTAPGNTISGGSTRITSYDTAVKRCSGVTCHTLAPPNVNWVQ
jgi:predicted CxxxxCH...CXXCH cytochrome family protein